jgi:para-nitrobenzyl esterase
MLASLMDAKWMVVPAMMLAINGMAANRVKIDTGSLEGSMNESTHVRSFLGIPYAAAPVGTLRWKEPQPAAKWRGVRKALEFGSRCMQGNVFGDMVFRDPGVSEDCLYLNVWTPAASAAAKLPVMVWIYGGGFVGGAASEPRQDGSELAKKGVVVVSFNYRLGVFGFLSHPELTAESGHQASGNYGLLDQVAALRWVHKNIAAFGGDPGNVTIFGESAGSFSVSALMASPLSRGLLNKAIGESGAFFSTTLEAKPLAESEKAGEKLAAALGAGSLAKLRAVPAADVLSAATKLGPFSFVPNVDGYFLPETPAAIFAAGQQSHVPLLAGWNANEGGYNEKVTAESYTKEVHKDYGDQAAALLKLFPASTDDEARESAAALSGDKFIALSTWRWIEAQKATGQSPVYRYRFDQAPPLEEGKTGHPVAYHSAEIEFVFGALASKKLPWREEDWKLSDLMSTYWSNFAKTGNPNGPGLPEWPAYDSATNYQVMHLIGPTSHAAPDPHRARYEFINSLTGKF